MTRIKICGLTEEEAFDTTLEVGADYAGLVFYPPSPRHLEIEKAARLARRRQGSTKLVGLFVAPEVETVAAVLQAVPLEILQIYGSAALAAALRQRFGLPVWRQLGVASAVDFPTADEEVDGFVVEAKPPAGASRPGGNGIMADWSLLAEFSPSRPWLLAGGLNPDNVATALQRVAAPGVDVSSGVETAPGRKSPALIRQFVASVRQQSAEFYSRP